MRSSIDNYHLYSICNSITAASGLLEFLTPELLTIEAISDSLCTTSYCNFVQEH